ncbi:hypothetical protein BHM03_00045808 [Ensete ventricosum]|nr:hypothetical protein BHM03_00045808 [Ensete ventricosum]
MRLKRVESLYTFLLHFRSEGNKEGQQGMARPPARGRPTVAKARLQRGGRLRPGPLQGVATRGHDRLRPAREGLPAARPQGPTARGVPARVRPALPPA